MWGSQFTDLVTHRHLGIGFVLVALLASPGATSTAWELASGPVGGAWGEGVFTLESQATDDAGDACTPRQRSRRACACRRVHAHAAGLVQDDAVEEAAQAETEEDAGSERERR